MQTSTDATSPIETHAKHHEVEISVDVLTVARMLCQTSMDRHKGDVNTVQETQVHIAKHSISNATRPSKGSPRSKETMV